MDAEMFQLMKDALQECNTAVIEGMAEGDEDKVMSAILMGAVVIQTGAPDLTPEQEVEFGEFIDNLPNSKPAEAEEQPAENPLTFSVN